MEYFRLINLSNCVNRNIHDTFSIPYLRKAGLIEVKVGTNYNILNVIISERLSKAYIRYRMKNITYSSSKGKNIAIGMYMGQYKRRIKELINVSIDEWLAEDNKYEQKRRTEY